MRTRCHCGIAEKAHQDHHHPTKVYVDQQADPHVDLQVDQQVVVTNQLACGHLLHQVAVAVAEVYVDQVQQWADEQVHQQAVVMNLLACGQWLKEPLQLLPQVAVAEVEE